MLKRVFNLLVSMLVRGADWVVETLGRVVGRTPRAKCIVLAYHSVSDKERGLFAAQMDTLLKVAKPVHANIKALPAGGGRYASVTFDDGFENIYTNALPELKKRGIPSTLFIVSDFLGQSRAWEHRGGDDTRQERVMTEEQLREIPNDLVLIGSHTMTHPFLPKTSGAEMYKELLGSRLKLEKMANCSVKMFSFPYGAFTDEVVENCRKSEYDRVFTALPVFAFAEADEFVTGRVGTSPTDWPIEFRLRLAGAYRWLPQAFALKRKLVSLVKGKRPETIPQKTGEERAA
jgi:peptidoglycan/xylan/chitin deacetylase (PgdA/CDA1 family)